MPGDLVFWKKMVPLPLRMWMRLQQRRFQFSPPLGMIRFGSLDRVQPICENFGFGRGMPIDRYYIEKFLAEHSDDIRGRVLEFGHNQYTKKFGGDKVERSDVFHVDPAEPDATIVADLSSAVELPENAFDCIICTQTLPCIFDVKASVRNLHRMLKPGGVLLMTNPGVGQVSERDWEKWGEYWRFTSKSVEQLLEDVFGRNRFKTEVFGNVFTAVALLQGIASHELSVEKLNYRDFKYQVSIVTRALKIASIGFLIGL